MAMDNQSQQEKTPREFRNSNPFSDPQPPTPPPPSYSTYNTTTYHLSPSLESASTAYDPYSSEIYAEKRPARYYIQKRSRKGPIICVVLVITIIMLIIALTIFGTVYHWGRNVEGCETYSDGTNNGFC